MARLIGRRAAMAALVGAAAGGVLRAADSPPAVVKIGMLQSMFKDVSPAQVRAASIPFKAIFKEQTGLNGDVDICPDHETLAARLQSKEYALGVFHGFEYAWVKPRHPDLRPLAITKPPVHRPYAVMVVGKDSPAKTPADITGESVALPRSLKAYCHLYHDRLRDTLPPGRLLPAKLPGMTPEEAMDAVINGDAQAAVVDVSSLNTYQVLKPGAFNALRVLSRSEPFPPAVIAYRAGTLEPAAAASVRAGLTRANGTAQGRLLLTFWNLKGFEDVPADFDTELKRIAQVYPPPTK